MTAQILAAVIFVGMFALIIMDKFERQYVTLGSAALVLVVVFGICMHSWDAIKNALNLGAIFRADFWYGASESASSGVNWSTIFFITGMMIMVEGLGKSGFFRWLCLSLAKLAHYHVVPLLLCFMAMSAFLAMFIDSITVVLFLATVTLELAQILCVDPVPMILSEVFCANLGGAAVKEVLRGVDYKTLLFFIGLFISVAGLEQTGVLKLIAQFISNISGGSIKVVILIILLLSAVCSALIDNIPFAATMVPVVQSIAATQGMDLSVLAWALSLGTDLGGNATPIGASANVVATSVSAKSGHPISWGKYCKYCVPATLLVVAVSLGCLFLRYL